MAEQLVTEQLGEAAGSVEETVVTLDPVSWRQLAVLVLDGSGSMTEPFAEADGSLPGTPARTKAAAVDGAVKEFVALIQVSRKKANFTLSLVAFNDRVTQERPPQPVADIDLMDSFDPTANGVGGGTAIYAGMESAYEIAQKWLRDTAGSVPVSVVIAVLSDGECGDSARTHSLAEKIKSEEPRISIAGGMFATKGRPTTGTQLLQAIVTEPRLYAVIYSAAQLRTWFHDSMTTTALGAQSPDERNA